MKSIFKKIAFVLALAMVVTMLPAKTAAAASDGPQMYSTLKLYVGGDKTGNYAGERFAKVWNKDGYTVSFVSDNEAVAAVNAKSGRVTAVSVGTANVTATFTAEDGTVVNKTCVVTVKKNAVAAGLSSASTKLVTETGIAVGETVQLTAVRKGADGEVVWSGRDVITDGVRFTSSDTNVFTVQKTTGKITGVAEGEATLKVWAVQSEGKDSVTGEYPATTPVKEYTVKVTGFSAEATGVKEITVSGSFTKDSAFTVKKGTQTINFTAAVAEDGKTAVLALDTKLTKGTYTVSCGSSSADITVEDEKVAQIIIKENGGQVTTDSDRHEIYVHYDVLNQYGESVRKNYTITWTSSFGNSSQKADAERGLLTFKDASTAITYGSQVIITGVYAKSGAVVNATVTAGQANCVGKIEVVGVLKKDTTTVLKEIPADFVNGDYVLVYSMLDRLGYPMEYSAAEAANLSFVSLSQLLFTFGAQDSVMLDGEEYGTIAIVPNAYYATQGGNASVQVISKVTGDVTPVSLVVLSNQILQSFNIIAPDFVIAEGEDVPIPYEALDTEGKTITNFRVLSEYLTLVGDGFYMVENNDGTADLRYAAPANCGATDDVDATVMLMSTVTRSGNSSSVMLSVKETARVNAVEGLHKGSGDGYVLEGGSITVYGDAGFAGWGSGKYWLYYYDQHDRSYGEWTSVGVWGENGYGWNGRFKIGVNYTGDAFELNGLDSNGYFTSALTLNAKESVTTTMQTETIEFYLYDTVNAEKVSGSSKKLQFTIVDISKCADFAMGANTGNLKNAADSTGFWVSATLANGVSGVPVPEKYIEFSYTVEDKNAGTAAVTTTGSAISFAPSYAEDVADEDAANMFVDYSVTNSDKTHPNKSIEVTVKASIYALELDAEGEQKLVDNTLSTKVKVGIDAKKAVTLYAAEPSTKNPTCWIDEQAATAYIRATKGVITYADLMTIISGYTNNYDQWNSGAKAEATTVTITKLAATESGLYPESGSRGVQIVSSSKSSDGDMITNAEIGDTFVATYTRDAATLTIYFTVGADTTAAFTADGKELAWK